MAAVLCDSQVETSPAVVGGDSCAEGISSLQRRCHRRGGTGTRPFDRVVVSGKDNLSPSYRSSTWNSFCGKRIRRKRRLGCRGIGRSPWRHEVCHRRFRLSPGWQARRAASPQHPCCGEAARSLVAGRRRWARWASWRRFSSRRFPGPVARRQSPMESANETGVDKYSSRVTNRRSDVMRARQTICRDDTVPPDTLRRA